MAIPTSAKLGLLSIDRKDGEPWLHVGPSHFGSFAAGASKAHPELRSRRWGRWRARCAPGRRSAPTRAPPHGVHGKACCHASAVHVVRSRARVRLIFATDTEVEAWIDALEAGDVERVTNRRTWAEVTADGAFLRGLPTALAPLARESRLRYAPRMSAVVAKVQQGRIKLDESTDLPDGTMVQLYIVDHGDELDENERQALDDALEEATRSVARGETIPAEDVLRMLDADG
jgi:hypothetical protein